jgi:hypothetical protein
LAGEAAQRLSEKYGPTVGAMLGVHPAIMALKRVVMNPLGDALLGGHPAYDFERAYMKGARKARREKSAESDPIQPDPLEPVQPEPDSLEPDPLELDSPEPVQPGPDSPKTDSLEPKKSDP